MAALGSNEPLFKKPFQAMIPASHFCVIYVRTKVTQWVEVNLWATNGDNDKAATVDICKGKLASPLTGMM